MLSGPDLVKWVIMSQIWCLWASWQGTDWLKPNPSGYVKNGLLSLDFAVCTIFLNITTKLVYSNSTVTILETVPHETLNSESWRIEDYIDHERGLYQLPPNPRVLNDFHMLPDAICWITAQPFSF